LENIFWRGVGKKLPRRVHPLLRYAAQLFRELELARLMELAKRFGPGQWTC